MNNAAIKTERNGRLSAEDWAQAALDMIAERHRLNEHAAHHIQVGIGIATGRVIAGCMGSKDRVDYTVLGERVNLASRLCGQAEPGKIVIDQTTREQLAEIITAEPMSPRKLKGFSDEVLAYELIELRALAVNA